MKIVADENIPAVKQFFGQFGEIEVYPGRNLTAQQVKDADILLVRSVTKVNQSLLEGSRVKFVGTCTIGIDHLDVDYLNASNIRFSNAPGCNADGVVQYDLVALSSVDADWQNRKIGVVGYGNVGSRLVKALVVLGVECVVYDPFLSSQENDLLTSLDEVLACDIICMHVPHTTTGAHPTHHMVNMQALQKIKPGSVLLNAGRGGAIDNEALLEHLDNGADLKVILDVWEHEPNINVALMERVKIATSHIAGYGFEGKLNGSAMVFNALLEYFRANSSELAGVNLQDSEQFARDLLKHLKGEPESVLCSSVNQALTATYDILADDERFRLAMREAEVADRRGGLNAQNVAKAFDLLRKSYPIRREFNHFKICTNEAKTKDIYRNMGFAQNDE